MALNLEKLKLEWRMWFKAWKRGFRNPQHQSGAFTNAFVEAARVSGYMAGHIEAVVVPVAAIESITLLVWWLL
jgi:hypothetical protein